MTNTNTKALDWGYIIVHHTAGKDHPEAMSFDDVKKLHIEQNVWADIGYHWLAERIENIPVVLVGRPEHIAGAHASGWNSRALGIALVGNYETSPVDMELLQEVIRRILVPFCIKYQRAPDRILGHRDTKATLCPGINLYKLLPWIREEVQNKLPYNFR